MSGDTLTKADDSPSVDPVEPARRSGARPRARIAELDGLRGIALTLVVLFHLFGQGRVSGGVDVFLFVSGVVLTLSLLSAVSKGEQGRVWRRWGRTFGRLAPPAAIVLLAVVGMAFTILAPWTRDQTLVEVASAALYVENWQLISSQLAYGAAGPLTSPVQHFWSLSIQGQLFIAVPLLVALVYAVRRLLARPGVVLWVLAALGTVASFVYATLRHADDPAATYFDTFARAWEFGAGVLVAGLLALGVVRLPWAALLGWVGLAAILASGFVIDGAQAFPGPWALVPVGGAALVVLSTRSSSRVAVGGMLRSRVFAWLALVSYALYLWHWPVLIAYLALRDRAEGVLGWRGAIVVLGVSVVLAVVTRWVVEKPLAAHLPRLRGIRLAAPAVLSIALVVAVALGSMTASHAMRPVVAVGGCQGAAANDPERPECADAVDPDAPLVPAFDALLEDDDNRPECWNRHGPGDVFTMCSLGPEKGYTRHLLAVGDSHSNTLLGVYEEIALTHGWRIDVSGRGACHWTDSPRKQPNGAAWARSCEVWNDKIDHYVATTPLDGIIVTNSSRATYVLEPGEDLDEVRSAGFASAWAHRMDPTTPIIAIRDNPIFGTTDDLACVLDADRVKAGECVMPREEALRDDGLESAVALDPYAHLVDLNDYMCDDRVCSLVVGGVITTRDGRHLTATYAHTLTPYLDRKLGDILGG
jgi:peptidoglycan/LPS O-acetylase OafA/YrhL